MLNMDRITRITITPVAFHDLPLLNTVGVHEPFALRAIVEVETADGLSGLGETYGDEAHLARLHAAADALIGCESSPLTMRPTGWSGCCAPTPLPAATA